VEGPEIFSAERQARLDHELVPLPVAANVAYFHITDAAHQVRTESDLADVVPLVAIALSTVAPIHADNGPVGAAALRALLYGERRPNLDNLSIRRGDLRTAMITLREARAAFGSPR
jgi:hypothetical protein